MNDRSDIKERVRQRSKELSLLGSWDAQRTIRSAGIELTPHIWKWEDLRPLLFDAKETFTLEDADRRFLMLSNPSLYPKHQTTNTLYVAVSAYLSGENAPAHKHSANASRLVLEGDGGFTNVGGEKCAMARGDLIMTPNDAWHDHGNDGKEPIVWVDVLDIPLAEALRAKFYEHDYRGKKGGIQDVTFPPEHSQNLYATGGLRPTFLSHAREAHELTTPVYVYPWEATEKALKRLRGYKGSPTDGIVVEYVNPLTGQSATPTIGYFAHMLRAGEQTSPCRRTPSYVYCCLEGQGETRVGDTVLEWRRNDIFVVPGWSWHHHVNKSRDGDALLISATDAPALKNLGLFREEVK